MLVAGCIFINGLIWAEVAADPTPAYFHGGFGFASDGRLCVATNLLAGEVNYCHGFRMSNKGAVIGSVSGGAGTIYQEGMWNTDTDRLRISDGVSAVTNYDSGSGFVASGRLGLSYP